MFTGIIDHCGKIMEIRPQNKGIKLTVHTEFEAITEGESIAVDGACLTAIEPTANNVSFELSPETLKHTIAHTYQVGALVNLERSLTLSDKLGGHFVLGHVDATARLQAINPLGDYIELIFSDLSEEASLFCIPKGSITVNGISLTLNEVTEDYFKLMLIPHTWQRTNISTLKINDEVNLEYDYLARIIHHQSKPLLK